MTSNPPRITSRAIALIGALVACMAAGAVAALNSTALAMACVATVAAIAVTSAAARFAIVVAGGLLVFQSSDQLDASKIGYLVWVAVSTALAIAGLVAGRGHRNLADFRPLLLASAAVVAAIAVSLVVALSAWTPLTDSIRDAAPYALLAVSPFLAWDAARSRLGWHMEAIAVAAGLMASVAFAVAWLGLRGLADLPFATLGSSSGALSTLAFVVALAAILSRRPRRVLWVMVAAAVLTLLLITGTRSAFVLLVGPVAMLFAQGQRFIRAGRLAGAVVVVGFAVLALAFLVSQSGLIDVARLTERLGSIVGLGSNLSTDPSYMDRAGQLGTALSAFAGSPVVGVGLGFRFESAGFGGAPSSYTIDTGLSLAAKFGLIGLGLLGIAAAGFLSFFRRLRPRLPEQVRLAVVGFAVVKVAGLVLGNPLEDKGFGLAVAILVAWAFASARTPSTNPNTVAAPGVNPAYRTRPPIRASHRSVSRSQDANHVRGVARK